MDFGLHASPLGRNIKVPQAHWDFTSERVLTMERVQGVHRRRRSDSEEGSDGTELVKALLFSVFEGGLRHGCSTGICMPATCWSTIGAG